MRVSDLTKHVGKTVGLDLISGNRVTAKIEAVSPDGYATIKQPFIYIPQPNGKIMPVPYSAPLYEEVKTLDVSADHIIAVLDCPQAMIDAYAQMTGGLSTVAKPKLVIPT